MIVPNKTIICILTSHNVPNTEDQKQRWHTAEVWPMKMQKEDSKRSVSLAKEHQHCYYLGEEHQQS